MCCMELVVLVLSYWPVGKCVIQTIVIIVITKYNLLNDNRIHFELAFDETCARFRAQFGDLTIRERQVSKVRYELSSFDPDGSRRRLPFLFEFMESMKESLKIQEYSIAQTSLEQIFNQFASEQEEETGRPIIGIAGGDATVDPNTIAAGGDGNGGQLEKIV